MTLDWFVRARATSPAGLVDDSRSRYAEAKKRAAYKEALESKMRYIGEAVSKNDPSVIVGHIGGLAALTSGPFTPASKLDQCVVPAPPMELLRKALPPSVIEALDRRITEGDGVIPRQTLAIVREPTRKSAEVLIEKLAPKAIPLLPETVTPREWADDVRSARPWTIEWPDRRDAEIAGLLKFVASLAVGAAQGVTRGLDLAIQGMDPKTVLSAQGVVLSSSHPMAILALVDWPFIEKAVLAGDEGPLRQRVEQFANELAKEARDNATRDVDKKDRLQVIVDAAAPVDKVPFEGAGEPFAHYLRNAAGWQMDPAPHLFAGPHAWVTGEGLNRLQRVLAQCESGIIDEAAAERAHEEDGLDRENLKLAIDLQVGPRKPSRQFLKLQNLARAAIESHGALAYFCA